MDVIIYIIRNGNHSPVKYVPVILLEFSATIQREIQERAKSPAEMNIRRFPSLIIVSHCLLNVPLDHLEITEKYFSQPYIMLCSIALFVWLKVHQ